MTSIFLVITQKRNFKNHIIKRNEISQLIRNINNLIFLNDR